MGLFSFLGGVFRSESSDTTDSKVKDTDEKAASLADVAPTVKGTVSSMATITVALVKETLAGGDGYEFHDERRRQLNEIASAPVDGVNRGLDKLGIPLEEHEYRRFSGQIHTDRANGTAFATTKSQVDSIAYENLIVAALNETGHRAVVEGQRLADEGKLTREAAETLRHNAEVAAAGAAMHTLYQAVKAGASGVGAFEDDLAQGATLEYAVAVAQREIEERDEHKAPSHATPSIFERFVGAVSGIFTRASEPAYADEQPAEAKLQQDDSTEDSSFQTTAHINTLMDTDGGATDEEQHVAQPAEEPVAQPAEEPVAQPAEEPVAQPAEEPVAQPAEEPVAQPAEEPEDSGSFLDRFRDFISSKSDDNDPKNPFNNGHDW